MTRLAVLLCCAVAYSASCHAMPVRTLHSEATVAYQAAYVADEWEWSAGDGDSSVVGEAFARRADGQVVLGAGMLVEALPLNDLAREIVVSFSTDGMNACMGKPTHVPIDARALALVRTTRADSRGAFRFDGLPAGDWLVSCRITWAAGPYLQVVDTSGPVRTESGKESKADLASVIAWQKFVP